MIQRFFKTFPLPVQGPGLLVLQILERFALTAEIPNEETAEAMLEADRIARDPNVKGYTSISELMEALDEE